jgi:hypothetical protein
MDKEKEKGKASGHRSGCARAADRAMLEGTKETVATNKQVECFYADTKMECAGPGADL